MAEIEPHECVGLRFIPNVRRTCTGEPCYAAESRRRKFRCRATILRLWHSQASHTGELGVCEYVECSELAFRDGGGEIFEAEQRVCDGWRRLGSAEAEEKRVDCQWSCGDGGGVLDCGWTGCGGTGEGWRVAELGGAELG